MLLPGLILDNKTIDICLTDKCNYNCKYCIADYTRKNIDINTNYLINFCNTYLSRNNHLVFTGEGEPTLHPDYITIITQLSLLFSVTLDTNLSSNIQQYINLLAQTNIYLTATWHSISADIYNKQFIDKIKILFPKFKNRIIVIVAIEPHNLHASYNVWRLLKQYNAQPQFIVQDSINNMYNINELYKYFPHAKLSAIDDCDKVYINFDGNIYKSYYEYLNGKGCICNIAYE